MQYINIIYEKTIVCYCTMDAFCCDVYNYYVRGGYWCIVVENIFNIILTGFTFVFFTFVSFFLDWDLIGKCESEESCKSISHYIISPTLFHPTGVNVCMFIFIIMFFVYWIWISFTMIKEIIIYYKYKKYYEDIGIDTDKIKVLSWSDITKNMINFDPSLTIEFIIGSIMKRENYLIAMIGSNLFDLVNSKYSNYYPLILNPSKYCTQSFLWLMNIGILNQVIPELPQPSFDVNKRIKIILKILGTIQIIILPFTLSILLIHYMVSFTTDFYTKKTYIGPKDWTMRAKILFREYNELPHIFNDRIAKSYKHASKYEQKFNSHMINIIMDKIIFLLGICLSLLVIMMLYDERIVMYIRLFDRNLLWYVAILTSLISLSKLMIVYPSSIDETSEEIMKEIVKHTHYFPEKWENGNKYDILNDFRNLYTYKIKIMLFEILSVFVMPFYMFFKLPNNIDIIIKFISNNTIHHNTLGYICKKSALSNDQNTSDSSDDIYANTNINTATVLLIPEKDDKMERSIQNFTSYYKKDNKLEFNITNSEINKRLEEHGF